MSKLVLAGDVGGTKVNLALCGVQHGAKRSVVVSSPKRYSSANFNGLDRVIETYLVEIGMSSDAVVSACFGVPGPVIDGRCQTVNLPWAIEASRIQSLFRRGEVKLINDLAAMAHGLSVLEVGKGLEVLRIGAPQSGNRALIAPGTGLGEALLFWDGAAHAVSSSEGGHCDFGPQDDEQIDLLRWLWSRHKHVSWEHVASGPAIHRIYRFIKETKRAEEPEDLRLALNAPGVDPSPIIASHASKGVPICLRALDLWLFCVGAEAGNLALKSLCHGGLFVGGGVVPHLLDLFKRPAFFAGFEAKGRMSSVISRIPIFAVTDQLTGLYGAALAARP